MKWIMHVILVTAMIAISTPHPLQADVEINSIQALEVDGTPVDLAASLSGKWLFVLTDKGTLAVYTNDGRLDATIPLETKADRIAVSPREDEIYLSNTQTNTVQIVKLDFIHQINTLGSPAKGPAEAPVTIAVFTDFQCTYCARITSVLDTVVNENPEKVRLVFKNFPLRNHQYAMKAAMAALAAGKQGKFWEFHDRLFENYNQINDQKINEIAKELQLDETKWTTDKNSQEILTQIRADMQNGIDAGLRGTPTIFVNGRLLRDRSKSGFQEAIDREVQKINQTK